MTSQTISASRLAGGLVAVGFAGLLALASGAAAQTMTANSAAFNAGFGRTAGEENRPVNVQLTDSNGNTTLVNGLIQSTVSGSIFGEVTGAVGVSAGAIASGGASSSFSGAGGGSSSSAIGNNLNVVVQGDNNTVIVNSTQNNTGAVTATSTTNGK